MSQEHLSIAGEPSQLRETIITRRQALRGLAVLGSGIALAPALSACGNSAGKAAGNGRDFNVQLNWIKTVQFAGFFYALDEGLYKKADIAPSFKAKGGTTDPLNVITAGSALIGLTSGQDAIVARTRGIPIVAFGAQFQKNPGALVSLKKKNITSAQDLVGKRIGIQATAQTSILGILKANNISKDDVKLITVGSDPSVLVRDQVDALTSFATNQPIALQQKGYDVNVISYSDLGRKEYDGVLVATEENYKKHKDSLTSFVSASQKGWEYALNNISGVTDLVVNKYGESLEVEEQVLELNAMKPLMASGQTESQGLFAMEDEVWQTTMENLDSAGEIDKDINLDDLVKKDIVQGASS